MIEAWLITYMLADPWENYTGITYSYNANFIKLPLSTVPHVRLELSKSQPHGRAVAVPRRDVPGDALPRYGVLLLGDAQADGAPTADHRHGPGRRPDRGQPAQGDRLGAEAGDGAKDDRRQAVPE
jgi:hypothetical protein